MNEALCSILVRQRAAAPLPFLDRFVEHLPCEHCGKFSNRLERHHRRFRSRGGVWTPANVALICPDCHRATTAEKWPESGLNVGTWEDPLLVPLRVWYADEMVLFDDEGGYRLAG